MIYLNPGIGTPFWRKLPILVITGSIHAPAPPPPLPIDCLPSYRSDCSARLAITNSSPLLLASSIARTTYNKKLTIKEDKTKDQIAEVWFFQITNMITDRLGRHEALLAMNHNYNKICDILSLLKIKSLFESLFYWQCKKRTLQVRARWCVLSDYLGMTCIFLSYYTVYKCWSG